MDLAVHLRLAHAARELRLLAEEPVPGVDRLGPAIQRRADDPVALQIAFAGRAGTDMHRCVGRAHVGGPRIGVGINGDRADPHGTGGADDPAGDFAAIGDQKR